MVVRAARVAIEPRRRGDSAEETPPPHIASNAKGKGVGGPCRGCLCRADHDRGESMTHCKMQHIPLSSAYLCQDCNCVGNCAEQCPACASSVLMSLSGVLDREVDRDERPDPAYSYSGAYPRSVAGTVVELTSMVA